MRITIASVIVFLFFCGCHRYNGDDLFYPAQNRGKVSDRLKEASGLAASILNHEKFWTINDSGNDPEVFLINDHGKIETVYRLAKIENRDWEDIAVGPGPVAGTNYVYVGDIGDNRSAYDFKYIYRFAEPAATGEKEATLAAFDTLVLKLPDRRRDTETLIIDPWTNDLFLVSKREDSVHLYQAHYPFANDTIVMEDKGKLPFNLIVAGSISADGTEVLLKNYNKIYYWKRSTGEPLDQTLKREPRHLDYDPEHQGEAIVWARDNAGFFTLGESSIADRAQLRFYKRR